MRKFHSFCVSTDYKAKVNKGRYVVTAEYSDGYDILYRTKDLQDAKNYCDNLKEQLQRQAN